MRLDSGIKPKQVQCGNFACLSAGKILALDLATRTGWATNDGNLFGVQVFDVRRGESPGMRFLRCRAWLNEMLSLLGSLDMIIHEQAHHRGGPATACCVGLVTEVQAFAADQGIELMPVHTATLKKFATGSGRANKADMINAAIKMGWAVTDDNEADAVLLLLYAIDQLVPKG
jgi:Holliday junction resolvasome RuvABC endonuclease subunit